jgi:hypothetical protein
MLSHANYHCAVGRSKLDRVRYEIIEHLLHTLRISVNQGRSLRNIFIQNDRRLLRLHFQTRHDLLGQHTRIRLLRLDLKLP